MPNILPAFIVNKIFVRESLQKDGSGYTFTLNNSFAPVVIQHFTLISDGTLVVPEQVQLIPLGQVARDGNSISSETPLPFSINIPYVIRVLDMPVPTKNITLQVDTRDAGEVFLKLDFDRDRNIFKIGKGWHIPAWLLPNLKASVEIDAKNVIGLIDPFIYGHFIEHLERCIYGGLWTDDGSVVREDVFQLVEALKMPLVRYPGGNFASGYHWEDGIGPKTSRPERFDAAWSAPESNQVGTDEYLESMHRLGAEPLLVVNDGSGTPEEAARWVAYCNAVSGDQARLRAENGHPEPYNVKYWGVGNEVWGKWQIGTTTAENYATRLLKFTHAMHTVDPTIRIVACGNTIHSEHPDDPGRMWNETVVRLVGSEIDYLSFHLYQPDQDGWKENYEVESLHHSVCAAPLEAERMIARMGAQLAEISPNKKIGVVLDEWNLWLTPPAQAGSMHQVVYTMRDALYCAGMLNVFQRQCNLLSMANVAQLVNVLPLVVTDATRAYPTPVYWPFWMYKHMQSVAMICNVSVRTYDTQTLGQNMPALKDVPYLDISATRSEDAGKVCISLVNRHPRRKINVEMAIKGFTDLQPVQTYLLAAPDPLTINSFAFPENVKAIEAEKPIMVGEKLSVKLPASSVLLVMMESPV